MSVNYESMKGRLLKGWSEVDLITLYVPASKVPDGGLIRLEDEGRQYLLTYDAKLQVPPWGKKVKGAFVKGTTIKVEALFIDDGDGDFRQVKPERMVYWLVLVSDLHSALKYSFDDDDSRLRE